MSMKPRKKTSRAPAGTQGILVEAIELLKEEERLLGRAKVARSAGVSSRTIKTLVEGSLEDEFREAEENNSLARKRAAWAGALTRVGLLLGLNPETLLPAAGIKLTPEVTSLIAKATHARLGDEPTVFVAKNEHGDACVLEGSHVSILSRRALLEKENDAKKVWVLRSTTPFLSGYPGEALNLMMRLLETTAIEYRFLFFGSPSDPVNGPVGPPELPASLDSNRNQARVSHEHFIRSVIRRQKILRSHGDKDIDLRSRVRGWAVNDKECMLALGVGVPFASSVILEYKDDLDGPGDDTEYHREYDIFVEIPVATFDPGNPKKLTAAQIRAWVQLSPKAAMEVYEVWEPVMRHYEGWYDPVKDLAVEPQPYHRIAEDMTLEREVNKDMQGPG